jgi:TatD DNase family protein
VGVSVRTGRPPAPEPLQIPVVDNHTHLDISRDDDEPAHIQAVIDAATAVGVPRMVQIGCDLPGARFTVDVIDRYPALLGGVALHPNEAPRLYDDGELESAKAEIERLASHPRVRVIGETGLDYFRTGPEGIAAQQESFRWHIDLAKRTGKPLQVHDREAHEDVLRILAEEGAPVNTVLHCFSGDMAMARACVERGYFLSFSGTVTFKNAAGLRDALAITPTENLLVETDAPFLAPTPHRGATNAPYLIPLTVRTMAGVLSTDVPSLCTALAANSELLYGPW